MVAFREVNERLLSSDRDRRRRHAGSQSAHRRLGDLGIVLVVVLGNVGLPVPEETVLALAGYLVWSGRLHLLPVLLVATASAVAGDNLGYWLGRRYGRAPVERYARWLLPPERVMAAERFVTRYGALAVGAARFVGGFRFLAGPLAGAVGLVFRSFFLGNLLVDRGFRGSPSRCPKVTRRARRRDTGPLFGVHRWSSCGPYKNLRLAAECNA